MIYNQFAQATEFFSGLNIPWVKFSSEFEVIEVNQLFLDLLNKTSPKTFLGKCVYKIFAFPGGGNALSEFSLNENTSFCNFDLLLFEDPNRKFKSQVYKFGKIDNENVFLVTIQEVIRKEIIDANVVHSLSQAVEFFPFGMFVKSVVDGYSYLIWNKKCEETYGISKDQILGKTDFEFFDKEYAEGVRAEDLKILSTKKLLNGATEIYTQKYSGPGYINLIKAPLMNQDGEVWGILGIIEDETQYFKIQRALNVSERRYRNLIENLNDCVWEVDPDMRYTYCSPSVKNLLGYDAEEIIGRSIYELMDNKEVERVSTLLEKILETKEEIKGFENQMIHKNGYPVYLETSGTPIFDEHKKYLGYLGVDRDIIGRKETENRMMLALEKERKLNKLRTNFISMASHEFRTPLSAILSSAELLEHYSQNWSNEKKQDHYKRIQYSAKHLNQMLSEIMMYGGLNSKIIQKLPDEIDLLSLCRNLISEIEVSDNHNHDIVLVSNIELDECYVNARLAHQIISNLLTNAIRYSNPGEKVKLKITRFENNLKIKVQDKGIGIPEEEFGMLYEPFFRGRNVGNISGTGLGLPIVKKAVELLEGEIRVESKENLGTTIKVFLPIKDGIGR